MFKPGVSVPILKLFGTIFKDFFFIQFKGVFFSKRYRTVNLDHPLDERIPFSPKHVGIYMDFTPMWGRAIYWGQKKYGKNFTHDFARFLIDLRMLYLEAAKVYRYSFSTTTRPPAVRGSLNFFLIHLFDPHLNCLPSLHIMVIWYCWYAMRELVIKHDPEYTVENVDQCPEVRFLFKHASEIGESVLFVKQHSVNCIPAALYMLTRIYPGFSEELSESIMRSMFTQVDEKIDDLPEIHNYMVELYNQFMNQANGHPLGTPLIQFIDEYPSLVQSYSQ